MKPVASLDKASLAILRCARFDGLRQPNKLERKSFDAVVAEAKDFLSRTHTFSEDTMKMACSRVISANCFRGYHTFDGKGRVPHVRLTPEGDELLSRLEAEEKEEIRHRENIRVARVSAWIAGIAAVAAAASAWYAKVQADSAALSARASEASIVPPQATPAQQSTSSEPEPEQSESSTPQETKPKP